MCIPSRPPAALLSRAWKSMRQTALAGLLTATLSPLASYSQEVPHLLNFQGSVGIGPASFDGTGKFKFALVNGDGTQTYWSHDGSSTAGSEPAQPVLLPVSRGLYSILLGDTSVTDMSAIPTEAFKHEDVRLRVWFDDGVHGSQLLIPDQRIAAVGYAILAETVPDQSITAAKIAPGAVGTAQMADGAIGSTQLATGAIGTQHLSAGAVTSEKLGQEAVTATQLAPGAARDNLEASGQTGITSGGIVMSDQPDNQALLTAGYQKMGYDIKVETDLWSNFSPTPNVNLRKGGCSVIWTGQKMIVWGGSGNSSSYNTGGVYAPETNTWTPTSLTNVPTARHDHTAVWTGTEMIIYGDENAFRTGGRYNLVSDSWTPLPTANAPCSGDHTAVWTGTEMIVWGGQEQGSYGPTVNTGARYNPTTNTWTTISTSDAPTPRVTQAVWTGTEMIIWGGNSDSGARYNPATDTWTPMSASGHPTAFDDAEAVWTGTEMIAGGRGYVRYNPATDTWTPVSTVGIPSNRGYHSLVWTGKEMIVCGGYISGALVADTGYVYDSIKDSWRTMDSFRTDGPGWSFLGIWTGKQILYWGGGNTSITFSGAAFTPARHLHLYQKP